jgi:hypothetical protein
MGLSSDPSAHVPSEKPEDSEVLEKESVLRQRQSRAGPAGLAAEKPRIDQKDSPLIKLVKFAIAVTSTLFKKADERQGPETKPEIPAHMHMLYGELYNFTEFWSKHPGGKIAIGLGVGMDATRLFESYHVFNNNHIKVMSKYKVRPTLLATLSSVAQKPTQSNATRTDAQVDRTGPFRAPSGFACRKCCTARGQVCAPAASLFPARHDWVALGR